MKKEEKKKRDLRIIGYPLGIFAFMVLVPWIPTINIVLIDVSSWWLFLTISWAISWYAGIFIWVDICDKEKKEE